MMSRQYVCVFRGSRDHYEVAIALNESGRLARLVTDFYTPDALMNLLRTIGADSASDWFAKRHSQSLPSGRVKNVISNALPLDRPWSRVAAVDRRLGRRGARNYSDAALVYNYYWPGFLSAGVGEDARGLRVVFQVHPVASQIRAILRSDRELSGIDAGSEAEELLEQDEVAEEFRRLQHADAIICASSFVRDGLSELGYPQQRIHVVPYGADRLQNWDANLPFRPGPYKPRTLRLLWVGQLAYRKGPHWLISAMRGFSGDRVSLTVVSRSPIPGWLGSLPENVSCVPGASEADLRRLYQSHDVFVMPSLVEGFGLVYLEALSHGLPVMATANSGARDIADHGSSAWIVPTGAAEPIADFIDRLLSDPAILLAMRASAAQATLPTWSRFRNGINCALSQIEGSRM